MEWTSSTFQVREFDAAGVAVAAGEACGPEGDVAARSAIGAATMSEAMQILQGMRGLLFEVS
jgi:hypothetical protein